MLTPSRKYLAFDIETAKEIAGDFSLWRSHRPLGICCAATLLDGAEPMLWHSKTTSGRPAQQMTRSDAKALVEYLREMTKQGYTILTWNGASFDFDVLAEESAAVTDCQVCAYDHVDMMFHLVCQLGFPISLEKAALGMGVPGKTAGVTGSQAPTLWAAGEYDKVLAYVAQDVRMAAHIAREAEKQKNFSWITQKGSKKSERLAAGWHSVRDALKLPMPDCSWMAKPVVREEWLAWMLK